jgi:hypothetical protein
MNGKMKNNLLEELMDLIIVLGRLIIDYIKDGVEYIMMFVRAGKREEINNDEKLWNGGDTFKNHTINNPVVEEKENTKPNNLHIIYDGLSNDEIERMRNQ